MALSGVEENIAMDLVKEIEDTHENLSPQSRRFLEFVRKNPDAAQRLDYRSSPNLPGWTRYFPYTIQTWPTLLGKGKLKEIERATVGVSRLIKSIPERVFENDPKRLAEFFESRDENLFRFLLEPPAGLDDALSRCDFVDGSKGFRCLEVNTAAFLGGFQIRFWQEICRRNPSLSRFFEAEGLSPYYRDPLEVLLNHVSKSALNGNIATQGDVNIAFVFTEERFTQAKPALDLLNSLYAGLLESISESLSGKILFDVDPGRIRSDRRLQLYQGDTRIHALVFCASGRPSLEVFRSFKAGNINLYNPTLFDFLGDKKVISLLSELRDSDLFDAEEKAIIRDHIPWSRQVVSQEVTYQGETFNLPEILKSRREEFVIKPRLAREGEGVCVGVFVSQEQWNQQVDAALENGQWLVQEYLESRPYLYQHGKNGYCPHEVVWGTFCLGSTYGGGFLRMEPKESRSGAINAARGASEGIILEI